MQETEYIFTESRALFRKNKDVDNDEEAAKLVSLAFTAATVPFSPPLKQALRPQPFVVDTGGRRKV